MADDQTLHIGIGLDTDQLQADAEKAKQTLSGIGNKAAQEGDKMSEAMKKVGQAVSAYFAFDQLKKVVSDIANVRGQFQQLEMSFKTMLGSSEKANKLMSQLIHTAAITPFGMNDVANGAKQLLAYGMEADKVNDTLIRLGDIAAGLSIPLNDLTYLYGTTMVQGRMYTQDLNQFLGRGIPLTDELAKQFGVAKDKVKELVEQGKIGFPQVEKAIKSMTDKGSKFGGLMEAQSKTITGQISNLEDAVEQMFNEIGRSSEGIISGTIGVVGNLVENYEAVGKALIAAAATVGVWKLAVMAATAATKGWTAAEIIQFNWMVLCDKAQKLLNATMLSNPYVLVATALAGLIAYMIAFHNNTTVAEAANSSFNDTLDAVNKQLEEYSRQTQDAIQKAQDDALATKERRTAMNLLIARYPSIIKKYIDEEGHLTRIAELKREIAEIDGKRKQATLDKLANNELDRVKFLADLVNKWGRNRVLGNNINYTGINNQWLKSLVERYRKAKGLSWYNNSVSIGEVYDFYQQRHNKAKTTAGRNATANRIEDFQDSITKMTDAQLDALLKELGRADSKTKGGKTAVFVNSIRDYLTKGNIETLTAFVQGIKQSRVAPVKDKSFFMNQLKELQSQRDALTYAEAIGAKGQALDKKIAAVQAKIDAGWGKRTGGSGGGSGRSDKTTVTDRDDTAKELAEEAQRRSEAEAKYYETISKQVEDGELDIEQKRLDMEQDGFDKQMKQLDLNHRKLQAENKRREQEMIEALAENKVNEWADQHPKATEQQRQAYRHSLLDDNSPTKLTAKDLDKSQQALLKSYADLADSEFEHGKELALKDLLSQYKDYWQSIEDVNKEYKAKLDALYEKDDKGNTQMGSDGKPKLRAGVTQDNVNEINRQRDESIKAVTETIAQRQGDYQRWCDAITDLSLENLETLLTRAKDELNALASSGMASGQDIAVAQAKVNKLQESIKKARNVSPASRSMKEWEDLYKVLQECEKGFESLGDTIGGTLGKVIKTAGQVTASTLTMVNGIKQLAIKSAEAAEKVADASAKGIEGLTATSKKSVSTLEKASIILTVISAAMQVVMQIVSLFNKDESYQKEIDALQRRIDALQWELDNAGTVRLIEREGKAVARVNEALAQQRAELIRIAAETKSGTLLFEALFGKVSKSDALLKQTASRLATAYANVAYTADKALGEQRFASAREELENISRQQLLINEQMNLERKKKKSDPDRIAEYEKKMDELAQQAVDTINKLTEEIMGGTSSDIASELSDAFFEAFKNGEDYAEAWHGKVNELIADIVKRMLVEKFLEQPLGAIFDKYKAKWFKDGKFAGIDEVLATMGSLTGDLNDTLTGFEAVKDIIALLPKEIQDQLSGKAEREGASKGIAQASQDSVDELNARATAIQGHTYSINEQTRHLVETSQLILRSVVSIDGHTDTIARRLASVESAVGGISSTLDDIALRGIRVR